MIKSRDSSIYLKVALFTIAAGVVIWLIFAIEGIVAPLLVSALLAFFLSPPVNFLERQGLNRSFGILLTFLGIVVLLTAVGSFVAPSVGEEFHLLREKEPEYSANIKTNIDTIEENIKSHFPHFSSMDLSERLVQLGSSFVEGLKKIIPKTITTFITLIIIVPIFTFFLLRDGREIKRSLISFVPNRYFEMSLTLIYKVNQQLGGYIRAKIVESIIVGTVVFVGLFLIDVRYSLVLGILAGVTNLIPYLGPIFGAIPAIILGLMEYQSAGPILMIVVVYIFAQIVDNMFVIPVIVAKMVNLHPLIVLMVVIVGSQLYGMIGMIIAVPVYSFLKVSVDELYQALRGYQH